MSIKRGQRFESIDASRRRYPRARPKRDRPERRKRSCVLLVSPTEQKRFFFFPLSFSSPRIPCKERRVISAVARGKAFAELAYYFVISRKVAGIFGGRDTR